MGLHLRSRAQALPTLDAGTDDSGADYVSLTAKDVELDDVTYREACAYARREGLAVVDLVPGDLDVEHALEVLGWTDPRTYRNDRLAFSWGPCQVLLVRRDVAERAKLDPGEGLDAADLAQAARTAKMYAPTSSDLVLAPRLRGRRLRPDEDARVLRTRLSQAAPPYLVLKVLPALAVGLGLVSAVKRRSLPPLTAVVAHALQPLLVLAGSGIRPADLRLATLARWPRRTAHLARALRAMATTPDAHDAHDVDAARSVYEGLLGADTTSFLASRRDDCIVCGSTDLMVLLETEDLHQRKPGRFTLERCRSCGHTFQNPGLSDRGLEFYYRDFYEGAGCLDHDVLYGAWWEPLYRGRVQMVTDLAEPRRWLDVGAGHGHFCLVADEMSPATRFEGLDMSEAVEEGRQRGWVDRAHRGQLLDLVDGLADSEPYDVVSMHHYLEHTRDPAAELDAAARLLAPGGLLLVEMPNPDSRMGGLLGRWWGHWFQPQHQHMLSVDNLESLLSRRGFTTIARQEVEPHQPNDLAWAVYLAVNHVAPPPDVPWRPPSTSWSRWRRQGALVAATPLLVAASLVDRALAPFAKGLGISNVYRLVARREE